LVTVIVNRKAADRAASGHPWIFSNDIVDRAGAAPGDAVLVAAANRNGTPGKPIGIAHYSSTSQIALRMLSGAAESGSYRPPPGPLPRVLAPETRSQMVTAQETIDRAFFVRRLSAAIGHRERVVQNSNAYRLVYSEGDLLPGLIVDRYGPYLVMQTLSQGMDRCRDVIAECLAELLAPAGIFARNDASVRKLEGLPLESMVLAGDIPERAHVEMNGLQLEADLRRGQKTGVYLDQRENYVAVAHYAARYATHANHHASGRILDCFTSTGGFALHCGRALQTSGAENGSIEAIDSSAPALATAEANARANGIANIQFRQADVFEFLSGVTNNPRRYSMIILDPPAFAKSRRSLDDAARGYKEINFRALKLLEPGGVLVTCSCSHHLSEAALLEIVAAAALDAGKTLRVLDRRTQASDHPILLTVPETHYLKCLILEVLAP
jgi:23S rRNA (cytosine1962-C5)-methyltransferase